VVAAVNEAVDASAGTVIEAGTLTAAFELDRLTGVPPVGAALESVTVQVVLAPGAKVAAAQRMEDVTVGRTRDRGAVWALPFSVAVICAVWSAVNVPAVTPNVAEAAPAGTLTVGAEGVTDVLLLETETVVAPPELATVTVQVEDWPALLRDVGEHCRALTAAGTSAIVADFEEPPAEAVMVTVCEVVIAPVEAWKVAEAAPAGTVTEAGAVRAAFEVASIIDRADAGALAMVIVQVVAPLDIRLETPHCNAETVGAAAKVKVALFEEEEFSDAVS
jgi:hypothetical protein